MSRGADRCGSASVSSSGVDVIVQPAVGETWWVLSILSYSTATSLPSVPKANAAVGISTVTGTPNTMVRSAAQPEYTTYGDPFLVSAAVPLHVGTASTGSDHIYYGAIQYS